MKRKGHTDKVFKAGWYGIINIIVIIYNLKPIFIDFSTCFIMHMKVNGRIWVDTEEGALLGSGRIELLENIKRLHSIRQAAMEMKMSYRQAWDFIDQMNARANKPLVISHRAEKVAAAQR